MEKNRSLLETCLHRESLTAVSPFGAAGRSAPVTFRNSEIELENAPVPEIRQAFAKLCQRHQGKVLEAVASEEKITGKRIAVLFSGGPAAGGHNVILGIKTALGSDNVLLGVSNGPKGLLAGALFEIQNGDIAAVKNLGGFDFLGSDRTKIKTEEQLLHVRKTVKDHRLDGLIIIGGDDSNSNAALLAEHLFDDHCTVIGVPKTIDGDLQVGTCLPISFGFDTATKIYSEMVGNILQDTPSSRKYWHFIRLMGRSASHVTLEVALQTKPPVTIISEEVAETHQSLQDIVDHIVAAVAERVGEGLNYGVVVVPEGLIEFIPEFRKLISELNELMASEGEDLQVETKLSPESSALFSSLPKQFSEQLLLDRDAHGNLLVSQIDTEKLLAEMVARRIAEFQTEPANGLGKKMASLSKEALGRFLAYKFQSQSHFFGYEGRCGAPTRFDAELTYNLGLVAGALALEAKTGYMAAITNFDGGGRALAIPLTNLITIEKRQGKIVHVIRKSLVRMSSPAFQYFASRRESWLKSDRFSSPGPRQYWGKSAYQLPMSVALNQGYGDLQYRLGIRKEEVLSR